MAATELLKEVNEKIAKIYEYQKVVESCEAILDKVSGMNICFCNEDEIVDISRMITPEQMTNAVNITRLMLSENKKDAENALNQFVTFNPVEPTKKFADGQDNPEDGKEWEAPEIVEVEKEDVELMGEAEEKKTTTTSNELDMDKIVYMKEKGYTSSEIAREFGITQQKVSNVLRNAGCYKKIDVKKIASLKAAGWTQKAIAEEIGIAQSKVSTILKEMRGGH